MIFFDSRISEINLCLILNIWTVNQTIRKCYKPLTTSLPLWEGSDLGDMQHPEYWTIPCHCLLKDQITEQYLQVRLGSPLLPHMETQAVQVHLRTTWMRWQWHTSHTAELTDFGSLWLCLVSDLLSATYLGPSAPAEGVILTFPALST
jgi:hypothetical protein